MNQLFLKHPWLRPLGCGLLICALVLSVSLPLLGMRAAEPENPILSAQPQEITVLQAGDAPGTSGAGNAMQTGGSNGTADGKAEGDLEQPDPEQPDEEAGQDVDPVPQPQPTQLDYSEATIGTSADSNSGSDGEAPGDTGETDETLPLPALDLGAVLTWYKYGSQPASIVCAADQTTGKRVLLSQLDGGALPYTLELTGLDAADARITGAFFAAGNAVPMPVDTRGFAPMSLPDGAEYQNYVFLLQAHVAQKSPSGEIFESDVTFTFVLRLESGIDLDLQLTWQTLSLPAQATCSANGSVSRTIKGDSIQDGLLQYSFGFLGESARDAEFLSADYRTASGETGVLTESGTLQMAPADGQDTETYYLSVAARVSGQTLRYTFVLTYEDGLDLQLQFTWYERSVTARTLLCDADKRAELTVKHNQLANGELLYKLALKGANAPDAQIISASLDGSALHPEKGSVPLSASDSGTTHTLLVTAKAAERTVSFTVTLRYQSDVSLQLSYTLTDPKTNAAIPCSVSCENGKTVSAEPIYDDQLSDGLLSYQLSILGEEAAAVSITSVKCYQSGSGRTETLAVSGSVTLLLKDQKTGSNTFTVTAASSDETYTFTIDLPYKHRGDNTVKIRTNLTDGMTVTNGEHVDLTVEAWTEDAQGNRTGSILASGLGTKLTVTLDGRLCRTTGQSGTTQQYVLTPENPDSGDRNEHTLTIYAEDETGNYGELTLTLIGKRTEQGQKIGTATVYIDTGVVGGGLLGPISYDVLSGERISYSIAKAVWDYDAGDPFGTAKQTFALPANRCFYNGSFDIGFYLRELPLSGSSAATLSGSWRDYGSTDAEILSAIDARFGAGTALASFWRCIYRNGIELSDPGDGLGEYSYTMASGWLYSVGGSTFYPGSGMSEYYLKDGDVLTLRFTLAYGWDVGGTSDRGGSVGYCAQWTGSGWTLNHDFQKTDSGLYACTHCGLEQDCPHTNRHWKDLGDGTCVEVCDDENEKQLGTPQPHELTCTPADGDTHTAACTRCGYASAAEHTWQDVPGSDTATCTQPGEKTVRCADCGAEKTEPTPARGHELEEWSVEAQTHYQRCHLCGETVNEGPHTYVGDGQYYQCSVCGAWHDMVCTGTLAAHDSGDGASHTVSCSACGLIHVTEPHQLDADGHCALCGYQKAPDPIDPAQPVDPTDPTDPEEGESEP